MTAQNYALIDTNGNVTGVIVYDGVSTFTPPAGTTLEPVDTSGAGTGWTYVNGAFVAPPTTTPPALTPAQQAANAIAAGIQIVSTSTPTLNGTYALDAISLSDINGLVTGIMLNGSFPDSQSTYIYHDSSFTPHTFPSIAAFKAFATAVLNFSSQVIQYAKSGGTLGAIPSNPVTIA